VAGCFGVLFTESFELIVGAYLTSMTLVTGVNDVYAQVCADCQRLRELLHPVVKPRRLSSKITKSKVEIHASELHTQYPIATLLHEAGHRPGLVLLSSTFSI